MVTEEEHAAFRKLPQPILTKKQVDYLKKHNL